MAVANTCIRQTNIVNIEREWKLAMHGILLLKGTDEEIQIRARRVLLQIEIRPINIHQREVQPIVLYGYRIEAHFYLRHIG